MIRRKIEAENILLGEMDGQMVGYLRLEYLWPRVPFIGRMVVREEYRRQAIGRAMLEFLEHHLSRQGHDVRLNSSQVNNPSAQAWHRAMRFQECGGLVGVNEGGIGEVFFRKLLTPSLRGNA